MLTYALSKLGYFTVYSLTVEDAHNKLNEYKPDIVLLDIRLPDGSGLSLIPRIKKAQSAFLVLSAYDDQRKAVIKQGAAGFIQKPFNLKRIMKSIVDLSINGKS